ncbi:MAG: LytTR family transcriptional regulator DNA-binding domain-containing protein [Porticoccaceae bacterium]
MTRAKRVNKAQLEELQQAPQLANGDGRSHIASKTRRGVDLIDLAKVRLFQADHKYVTAYHTEGKRCWMKPSRSEEEFDGRFVRIHRNALSLGHIEGLERNTDGQFFVRLEGLDVRPQVSRRHVAPLRKAAGSVIALGMRSRQPRYGIG